MERKQIYKKWIEQFLPKLHSFQHNGCFFYPYWKKQANYADARWQESVYTLALAGSKNPKTKELIASGIDFWCRLQNKNGSFPEYCRNDVSFPATAFSLNAVVSAIKIIGIRGHWSSHLIKAGNWLAKNNETVLANQQAAAALALLKLSKLLKIQLFKDACKKAYEKKLNSILSSQKGFYPEKNGFDLGYSTLTMDSLAQCFQITGDRRIIASAEKFCAFLQKNRNLKNTRSKANWIIANGFEILAPESGIIKSSFKFCLENYDFMHIPNDRHIATDLYRLYLAYENSKISLGKIIFCNKFEKSSQEAPNRILSILRPFGLHKLRKIVYTLK